MRYIYKKAFTLVELIVTITILAIIGTISFLSFQGYTESTRNSVRISDIQSIKHALEFFALKNEHYPIPSDFQTVTFSGASLWRQGSFGNDPYVSLGVLNKIPVDPLTGNEYAYSVTESKDSYQIGYSLEGGEYINKSELVLFQNQAHAGTEDLLTAIEGNYDGKVLQTSTGGIDYVRAVPSLILHNFEHLDILNIIQNKTMTYEGFDALPSTYSGVTVRVSDKLFDVGDKSPIVFQGSFDDLQTDQARLDFYEKLSKFYSDSQLRFKYEYEDFASVYADMYNPTGNFSDIACRISHQLLKVKCIDYSSEGVLLSLSGTGAETNTGMLLAAGQAGSYLGQWNFGSVYFDQGLQNPTHERSSLGMPGNLSRAVGTKWKIFTGGKSPDTYLGGYDVTGDGNENIIYGYGGKLYLGDIVGGGNVWETKVYDVKKILGVESILSSGEKSIIVALGNDWLIGVINGSTGELEWMSNDVDGPVKKVKPGWPGINYRTYDVDGDGIKEYHFKQWYRKYHAYEFFEQGGKVVGEALWSSEGYGDYNEGSDGYQPHQFSIGNIGGKTVVGTKGAHTYAFYSTDVNSSLGGTAQFQMPAFGKLITGGAGWSSGQAYFYDINDDGDDEYISLLTQETNNNKLSRVFASGLNSTGSMVQYMSLSNPYNVVDGVVQGYSNFSGIFPLKNTVNPEDSYILTYGRDPNNISTSKWMMLSYNGASTAGYKKTSEPNETFNTDIVYDKFDSSYSVSGIFNNGNKDYVVLSKGGDFYFYTFTGVDTFQSASSLKVAGSFHGDTLFSGKGLDKRAEENRGAGVFLTAADTDNNGLNEFVVGHDGKFKFYEIADTGIVLKKSYSYGGIPSIIKWGITEDLQDVYGISYTASTNIIDYYRSDSVGGNLALTKRTDGNFFSGGNVRDLLISKLGKLQDKYNRLMIESSGMYDARNANPSTPPQKLGTDYFYSYDMDNDGENEIFKSGKAYTFNSVGNHTLKYQSEGWAGDFNGDGVKDRAWAYCKASENYPRNVYFTVRSGVDNSQIVPDLDWGNGNGWCSGGGTHSVVAEDFDGDGIDELAAGVEARNTRILSFSGGSVTEGPQSSRSYYALSAFDIDNDGVKEVIQSIDKLDALKVDSTDNSLESIIQMNPGVVSTSRSAGGFPSIMRHDEKVYAAFRGVDGQVALQSWESGSVTSHFKNYYLNTQMYSTSDEIYNNNLMPIPTADVLLGDFTGGGNVEVLVGGGDGYIYILSTSGSILKAYDVGASIKRIIIGDTNEDGYIDILVSAEDGYIHQIASSRLNPPSIIRDGQRLGYDDKFQDDPKQSGLHFPNVEGAEGYFVQLYNRTKKSVVFDWIDIADTNSSCIKSDEIAGGDCISAGRKFQMIPGEIYQWRVQSYDDSIASPIALSSGFRIQ